MVTVAVIFGVLALIGMFVLFMGLILLLVTFLTHDYAARKTALKIMLVGGITLLVSFTLCTAGVVAGGGIMGNGPHASVIHLMDQKRGICTPAI